MGSAAAFASPGLQISVAADTTTTIYAKVTDVLGNASPCSTSGTSYAHQTPDPPDPPGPPGPPTSPRPPAPPAPPTPGPQASSPPSRATPGVWAPPAARAKTSPSATRPTRRRSSPSPSSAALHRSSPCAEPAPASSLKAMAPRPPAARRSFTGPIRPSAPGRRRQSPQAHLHPHGGGGPPHLQAPARLRDRSPEARLLPPAHQAHDRPGRARTHHQPVPMGSRAVADAHQRLIQSKRRRGGQPRPRPAPSQMQSSRPGDSASA